MQMTPILPDNYRPYFIPTPEPEQSNDNPTPLVRVPKFVVPKEKIKDLK